MSKLGCGQEGGPGSYGTEEVQPRVRTRQLRPLGARTRTHVMYRRLCGAIFGFDARMGLD